MLGSIVEVNHFRRLAGKRVSLRARWICANFETAYN